MRIRRHDKSDLVELDDGSQWRVWPGDIAATLQWLPTADIEIVASRDDPHCSHVLVDHTDGSRVRVIDACRQWPVEEVKRSFREG